jgi:hypothetical protein
MIMSTETSFFIYQGVVDLGRNGVCGSSNASRMLGFQCCSMVLHLVFLVVLERCAKEILSLFYYSSWLWRRLAR